MLPKRRRLLRKGCRVREMGFKEIGGIYMRIEVHVTLGMDIHSSHGGVGHAKWIQEAIVTEWVLFLLTALRYCARLRRQEAGIVLFLESSIICIIRR